MSSFNVISNIFKGGLPVIVKKIFRRLEPNERELASEWARKHATPIHEICGGIDKPLWDEAQRFGKVMENDIELKLNKLEIKIGGGGAYPFLYFLVRYFRPHVVVETGVAMGYSSRAILQAMQDNGAGHLYSSDFPYFREKNPESYIGCAVPQNLKVRWTLDTRGDEVSLPKFLNKITEINILHYDSDKSRGGRDFAIRTLQKLISTKTIVIMDDINDNLFFEIG